NPSSAPQKYCTAHDLAASSRSSALAQTGERFGGVDDWDVLVGLEVSQVLITGNDEIGLRGECAAKDGCIVGVAKFRSGDFSRSNERSELGVACKQVRKRKAAFA